MKTLFPKDFNWPIFIGLALLIRASFPGISWTCFFAILLFLHHFLLFFDSMGKVIPVRYLLGLFMCIQFFVGPTLAYNGFDEYTYVAYRMKIPESEYFGYAIPAVLAFILGLHFNSKNMSGEWINEKDISDFVSRFPKLPYWFIGVGLVASVVSTFFASELAFVFYLLGSAKFIGLFLLVIGTKMLKPLPLTVVIGSIVSSSLSDGMFHDLLTWLIFTAAVYAIKYRFGVNIKLIGLTVFIFMAVVIQLMKGIYRSAIHTQGAGIDTFTELYEEQNENANFFSFGNLANNVSRINQGFIITNIMFTIPDRVPFENGKEMMRILEAAFLPRFLAPNKLTAGNREIFTKYSGIKIKAGTSMGLSSLGDAYINFGVVGGALFMLVLGMAYNIILKVFQKNGKKYPILLMFTPLVFYYPIRPDCELQTILGHVVKSCFMIFVMLTFWKNVFKKRASNQDNKSNTVEAPIPANV